MSNKNTNYPSLLIGSQEIEGQGSALEVFSPIDGKLLSKWNTVTRDQMTTHVLPRTSKAFLEWRQVPAPQRGLFVKRIASLVQERKTELAQIISLEAGKTTSEALGEVQEWIDICDFAVGLSRNLHGLTIVSERPMHRMMEQWHPLGPIAVISAFNFPIAVWAWNAMLAFVCGDSVVWKPSEKTPLCAYFAHKVVADVLKEKEFSHFPQDLSIVAIGSRHEVGEVLTSSSVFPLVSATGSVNMGKNVAISVAKRLGRSLLELGGNNALILTPSANLDLALRAITFSAVGTAGQRCTSLRRLIVHKSHTGTVLNQLKKIYSSIKVGDPREAQTLVGPLIDEKSFETMQKAISTAKEQGAELIYGGERIQNELPSSLAKGFYVRPALMKISSCAPITQEETFAPLLYIMEYSDFAEALRIQNNVPQGLSSAIVSNDIMEVEQFLSVTGSDCGIANVNMGTSGAEIGGAFGGEKETGGGRESGSDSWKNYMRRSTNNINYGKSLPLAQGVHFDLL